MTERTIHVYTCDRCGTEWSETSSPSTPLRLIGFMVSTIMRTRMGPLGGYLSVFGDKSSLMPKEDASGGFFSGHHYLCEECMNSLSRWMKDKT